MIGSLAPRTARPLRLITARHLAQLSRALSTSSAARQAEERPLYDPATIERESDEVDVCIVGAGPAGLAAAIRLKQLERERGGDELRVVVLEKGPDVGASCDSFRCVRG